MHHGADTRRWPIARSTKPPFSEHETAYSHRDAGFAININGVWLPDEGARLPVTDPEVPEDSPRTGFSAGSLSKDEVAAPSVIESPLVANPRPERPAPSPRDPTRAGH